MVSPSDYTDETRVLWGRLVIDSIGAVVLAYFMYAARIVSYFIGGVTTALGRLEGWFERTAWFLTELPLEGMQVSFSQVYEPLQSFGIAGYVVGLLLVLATFTVLLMAIERVAGGGL